MKYWNIGLCSSFLLLAGCANFFTPTEDRSMAPLAERARATAKSNPETPTALRKRILVAPFLNKSRHGGDAVTLHGTSLVKDALLASGDFVLVQPEEISGHETFVNEFNDYNLLHILERARSYNVDGVVLGIVQNLSVRESGEETGLFQTREFAVTATVKVSIHDTSTQREVYSTLASADVTEQHMDLFNNRTISNYDPERGKVAVGKAIEKIAPSIPLYAKKIAWTGRIAKVDLHRYYINAGETSGIARNQLLKVYEEGQPVYDPENRTLLGIAPGRFKGILKVVEHFGQDGSIAVVHSGGGFREKDRVEIFSSMQN